MTDIDLKNAEEAADRYDGLGVPMNSYSYQAHIAAIRAKARIEAAPPTYGPDFNGVVRAVSERFSCEPVDEMLAATRETQGQPVDAEPRKER